MGILGVPVLGGGVLIGGCGSFSWTWAPGSASPAQRAGICGAGAKGLAPSRKQMTTMHDETMLRSSGAFFAAWVGERPTRRAEADATEAQLAQTLSRPRGGPVLVARLRRDGQVMLSRSAEPG